MVVVKSRVRRGVTLLVCTSIVLVVGGATSSALGAWPFDIGKKRQEKKCSRSVHQKPCPKKSPCAKSESSRKQPCAQKSPCPESDLSDLPRNASAGECYAKVYIAPTFKTVTERQLVQEASEEIEIVPAEFKWVEEQVVVKETSTQLEVVPAEYKWVEKTIQTGPAHTGWVVQKTAHCTTPNNKEITGDVFCLRTTPAEFKTVRIRCLVKPASVREVKIPAEYQTIRKQVVSRPATTRKIAIPAKYEDVSKSVMVCPERVKWEHIVCEEKLTTGTVNKIKTALTESGYKAGPLNGELGKEDWVALAAFQQKNGLGVGQLSYETLKQLKVSIR